jgi:hypothetical protein
MEPGMREGSFYQSYQIPISVSAMGTGQRAFLMQHPAVRLLFLQQQFTHKRVFP